MSRFFFPAAPSEKNPALQSRVGTQTCELFSGVFGGAIISVGMVDYVNDPEKISRAGSHPLIVKAVALNNFNCNPVVSIEDSNRILIENYATKFLKELSVVFLFD